MTRILWPTVAVLAVGLLGVAIQAQQRLSSTHRKEPPAFGIAGLRMQMQRISDMHAQQLAEGIGLPPADCQVDVSHTEDDELGEGLAEFIADVFHRAYWNVEVSPREQLTSATPGILIHFSSSTAAAAATLQAAFSQLERTDIAPILIEAPRTCSLHITVNPQPGAGPQ